MTAAGPFQNLLLVVSEGQLKAAFNDFGVGCESK